MSVFIANSALAAPPYWEHGSTAPGAWLHRGESFPLLSLLPPAALNNSLNSSQKIAKKVRPPTSPSTAHYMSGGEEDMGVMQLEEAGLQGLQGS